MEAQKSQVFANAGASAAISNFKKKCHDRYADSSSAIQWNGGVTFKNGEVTDFFLPHQQLE